MELNKQDQSNFSSQDSQKLLSVKNLAHNFDYPLFENISFDLYAQQSIAIIGVSGCGKSTLLNIISSLLQPSSGEVFYKNNEIYKLSIKNLEKLRREELGIVFQSHYLFRGFNVDENLHIAQLLANEVKDTELLKKLKIDHITQQGIGEISGGQQQRVSIARVLNKQPQIIFADEPTGNLDETTAHEVMDVMFDYIFKKKAGMILVTHEKDLANRCDQIYQLHNNKLERIK